MKPCLCSSAMSPTTQTTNSTNKIGKCLKTSVLTIATALCVAFSLSPSTYGQTFTVLHTFTGAPEGQNPYGGVINSNGTLFGTTNQGGTGSCSGTGFTGCGTVFKINSAGTETVLHNFLGAPDGVGPGYESLVSDGKGNFYGTTIGGGTGTCKPGGVSGCGTVFKITGAGTETVVYSFQGGADGEGPNGTLALDSAGNLYGTTLFGGSGKCTTTNAKGCGTVFEVTSAGTETVLYSFKGGKDGANPWAGVVRDTSGNLYGTTFMGGGNSTGGGTVFVVSPTGAESVLYSFSILSSSNGYLPYGKLVRDAAGNLYGTTGGGGALNRGTVFKLSASGTLTVLHSFAGGTGDGSIPVAGLVRDAKGNLYGTTSGGGAGSCQGGCGTIFKVSAAGTETLLYSLSGITDGLNPFGSLTLDSKGNLFGTANVGGDTTCGGGTGCGTAFKFVP